MSAATTDLRKAMETLVCIDYNSCANLITLPKQMAVSNFLFLIFVGCFLLLCLIPCLFVCLACIVVLCLVFYSLLAHFWLFSVCLLPKPNGTWLAEAFSHTDDKRGHSCEEMSLVLENERSPIVTSFVIMTGLYSLLSAKRRLREHQRHNGAMNIPGDKHLDYTSSHDQVHLI